jgi:hypothetical protein
MNCAPRHVCPEGLSAKFHTLAFSTAALCLVGCAEPAVVVHYVTVTATPSVGGLLLGFGVIVGAIWLIGLILPFVPAIAGIATAIGVARGASRRNWGMVALSLLFFGCVIMAPRGCAHVAAGFSNAVDGSCPARVCPNGELEHFCASTQRYWYHCGCSTSSDCPADSICADAANAAVERGFGFMEFGSSFNQQRARIIGMRNGSIPRVNACVRR